MDAVELVLVSSKGVEDGCMIKALSDRQPPLVTSLMVNICHDFVHASEFCTENLLHLVNTQLACALIHPSSKSKQNCLCVLIPYPAVDIKQTSQGFMDGVIWDIPTRKRSLFQLGKLRLGKSRKITSGKACSCVVVLTLQKFSDKRLCSITAGGILQLGITLCPSR